MTNLSDSYQASILDANKLRQEITKEISNCTSITLLSAYLTSHGARWLIEHLPKNAELIVVGRFIPRDFKSGASDIEAIRLLLSSGYVVKALSSLHAKVLSVDSKIMFIGSANYTAKGLGIVNNHNIEASVKLELTPSSQMFISNVVSNSISITSELLIQLEKYISELDDVYDESKENEWPATVFKTISSLYVKDFPLAEVHAYNEIYTVYPKSDFSRLYDARNNYTLARSIFRSSQSYVWLIQLLSKEENIEGISYGRLSNILHNTLLDDPSPYRKTVKDLQSNLYSFIREYAADVVQFYTPGARSEFIKLKNNFKY